MMTETPGDLLQALRRPCSRWVRWLHARRRDRTFSTSRGQTWWWCPCGVEYRRSAAYRDKMSLYLALRAGAQKRSAKDGHR